MKTDYKSFGEKLIGRLKKTDPDQLEIFIQKLIKENNFYTTVLNNFIEGLIVTDPELRILFINDRGRKIIRISPQVKIVNEPLLQIIRSDVIAEGIKNVIKEKETIIYEDNATSKAKKRIFQLNCIPMLNEDEKLVNYVFILKDITEQKKTESEILRAEKLASLATLTAGVAHDVKNPLNSINIHAQLLKRSIKQSSHPTAISPSPNRTEQSIDIILEEIKRLSDTVDRFISTVVPVKITPKICSINKLIENIIETFKFEIEEKGIKIKLDLDPEVPETHFDEGQVRRALINLLKNAIEAIEMRMRDLKNQKVELFKKPVKDIEREHRRFPSSESFVKMNGFTEFEGEILIRSYFKDKFLFVDFQDNGCGIPEEDLKKIFEPYYTTKFSGAGLGLMLVHQVIIEHKGTIQIQSKLNEGTVFTIALPLTKKLIRLLPQSIEEIDEKKNSNS